MNDSSDSDFDAGRAKPRAKHASEPSDARPHRMDESALENEPRNLVVLAAHQILLRVGWIFKTESVIMPAFMDFLSESGSFRAWLPVLNRYPQSIVPFFFAHWLKMKPRKSRALLFFTLAISVPFLTLSGMLFFIEGKPPFWLPMVFLGLYGVFFACAGLMQLTFGTLQGKLIRPERYGRLMALAAFGGSIPAVGFALWLMPGWLALPKEQGFFYIFAFTGVLFLLAGLLSLALSEPADDYQEKPLTWKQRLGDFRRIPREDPAFRRLAPVALLFSAIIILFPHYQALGRTALGTTHSYLVQWVVVQNIGTGLFSLIMGWLADARGNRLALRCVIFAAATAPLLAFALAHSDPAWGRPWFAAVFFLIGLTPVGLKTLINYTLEISPPSEHPRYLSTLSLIMAAPFVLSPAVGLLLDAVNRVHPLAGFDLILGLGTVMLLVCGCLTFRLVEPRDGTSKSVKTPVIAEPND
ncbi:MAG: MFS transporter [Planctomycetales bacterium]